MKRKVRHKNKGGWIRIVWSTFTIAFRVNENIGELDVSMQDVQCGHVHECVDSLLEEPPSFILGDAFVDSLEVYLVSLASSRNGKGNRPLLTFDARRIPRINKCVNQHEQTNVKVKVGQHKPSGYKASSTPQATSGPKTSPSSQTG